MTVGPTLGAALRAGLEATETSEGLVDITLLDARLLAEGLPGAAPGTVVPGAWTLTSGPRRTAIVHRAPGLRFDLDGVAKGWLADRGLGLLSSWPGAVIDADGDLAVRCRSGSHWAVAVDDPRADGAMLAVLHLDGRRRHGWPVRWGVATSGTSVHRWNRGAGEVASPDRSAHRRAGGHRRGAGDGRGGSALRAEALAKAAVIGGSVDGLALLERAGVRGAVVLTDRGETLASPSTLSLLAE